MSHVCARPEPHPEHYHGNGRLCAGRPEPVVVILRVECHREPTNTAEGWHPTHHDVAEVISEAMTDRDLDTGWRIASVRPAGPTPDARPSW